MAEPRSRRERQARTPLPREDGDKKKPPFKTPRMRILRHRRRAAGGQLHPRRRCSRPGGSSRSRIPYSPIVPGAGARRQRRAHLRRRARRSTASSRRSSSTATPSPRRSFETEIPIFANGDELSTLLEDKERHDRGRADQPEPRLPRQPDPRLRPGDPADRPVRLLRPPRGRRRGDGRARRVRPLARRAASRAASRRSRSPTSPGIDEAKAELSRDRRLPEEPGALPEARRPDPQGRAALRPPGHRQDAAGARGGGGGGRAVLLHLGVGVRRGDRRHRRVARARPLQAGQGGRARRSSSSTSSTRSAARAAPAPTSAAATTSASRRSTRSSRRWTASSPTSR